MVLDLVSTAVVAAGGYFLGGVVMAVLSGGSVARMFAGSRLELAVQAAGGLLAVWFVLG
jgi:hypothetical protein